MKVQNEIFRRDNKFLVYDAGISDFQTFSKGDYRSAMIKAGIYNREDDKTVCFLADEALANKEDIGLYSRVPDPLVTEPELIMDDDGNYTLMVPMRIDFDSGYNREMFAEFEEKMPEAITLVDFISIARFAGDRKKAFLWFHAPSDWGKGLLISALTPLVTEVQYSAIINAKKGNPSAISVASFRNSLAMVINEAKVASEEFKEFENRIIIAEKNKQGVHVPLYAKVFTSASLIERLDSNVDIQFANRFSKIECNSAGSGSLTNFKQYGKEWMFAIRNGLRERIARNVAMYAGQENECNLWLAQFHRENCVAKTAGGTLQDQFNDDFVLPFISWMSRKQAMTPNRELNDYVVCDGKVIVRTRSMYKKLIQDFLDECVSKHDISLVRDEFLSRFNGRISSREFGDARKVTVVEAK